MKTVYLRQFYVGTIGDMKNLEQHFADMAEKGWMIDKIGLFFHRYRAAEPCQKRFFVDFLPQITAFDYPENEDVRDYRQICGESGWTFITANKQLHVFCADGENPAPIPIHTDNTIHAKIYLRACEKYELLWFLLPLFLFWFSSPLNKGAALFLSNLSFFMAIGHFLFLCGYFWMCAFVIVWYIRTKKAVKNGLPLPHVNPRLARLRRKVFGIGMFAFLWCLIIGVVLEIVGGKPPVIAMVVVVPFSVWGIGFWLRRQIDAKKRTRAENIGITVSVVIIMEIILLSGIFFALTNNTPPTQNTDSLGNRPALLLNDVGAAAPSNHSDIHVEGTLAVPTAYDYWETNQEGSVRTQVYHAVNTILTKWLYAHFAEEFAQRYRNAHPRSRNLDVLSPNEAAFWGAEKGMRFDYENSNAVELLLVNGKTILRLSAEGMKMNLTAVSQAVRDLW